MRLPHLDQQIALHWGEAGQLAHALTLVLGYELAHPAPRPLVTVLAFGPLGRVRARLLARQLAEQRHVGRPPRKPWRLTLRYDEVAALLLVLPQAPAAGLAWGEIQRVSLNLSRYVDFTLP
jgi:hypothetical protein